MINKMRYFSKKLHFLASWCPLAQPVPCMCDLTSGGVLFERGGGGARVHRPLDVAIGCAFLSKIGREKGRKTEKEGGRIADDYHYQPSFTRLVKHRVAH